MRSVVRAARSSTGSASKRSASILLAVACTAGCSVEFYQQQKVKFDRETTRNEALRKQNAAEIARLRSMQASYEQALSQEARLEAENRELRRRIESEEKNSETLVPREQ